MLERSQAKAEVESPIGYQGSNRSHKVEFQVKPGVDAVGGASAGDAEVGAAAVADEAAVEGDKDEDRTELSHRIQTLLMTMVSISIHITSNTSI
mmetsp:Transcript_13955/g.38359  ORF Transcript_13955/g.38359 Transcript_13955/m.38359 type:complete len:94 (-) Transcript_13955:31-312(-)